MREGKVLAIDQKPGKRYPVHLDCLASPADAGRNAFHTMYVQYDLTQHQDKYFATVRLNFPKFALVPMPNGASAKPDDWVYPNIHDCRVIWDH